MAGKKRGATGSPVKAGKKQATAAAAAAAAPAATGASSPASRKSSRQGTSAVASSTATGKHSREGDPTDSLPQGTVTAVPTGTTAQVGDNHNTHLKNTSDNARSPPAATGTKNASNTVSPETASPGHTPKNKKKREDEYRDSARKSFKKRETMVNKTDLEMAQETVRDVTKTEKLEITNAMWIFLTEVKLHEDEKTKKASISFLRNQSNHNHTKVALAHEITNNFLENPMNVKHDLKQAHRKTMGADMEALLTYNSQVRIMTNFLQNCLQIVNIFLISFNSLHPISHLTSLCLSVEIVYKL
jgi:hypothetical protein